MNEYMNILVVDDCAEDRYTIKRYLNEVFPKSVLIEADSVESGMIMIKSGFYDVVLFDFNLPDGTGLDLLTQTNHYSAFKSPVILLTGEGNDSIDIDACKAGANDYLEKQELNPKVLERAIRYAVSRNELMIELKDKNKQLGDLENLRAQTFSTTSDEINHPLHNIKSKIYAILDDQNNKISKEHIIVLRNILNECDTLEQIFDQFKNLKTVCSL